MIIGIIRYGKTIIIHPIAQPKPVPCSCWSMFFWKTQQKCHVIVNKLHDIHIEIYRGIEQTYFCRFLFGKSRGITYILAQQFYYVCTFRVTDQLLFSFFHGANDKVSNHTLLEPVGKSKKMNWQNCDMEMKIHAICDAKKVILKYFVLTLWKFAKIWAFFFLYGEF